MLFSQNHLLYIIQLIKASSERKKFDGIEEKMAPPSHPCPGLLVIRMAETAELLLQKENLTELARCNKKSQ